MKYLVEIAYRLPAILLVILVHEYAHGLTAFLFGDDTGKKAGRLTFNPFNHMDPIGTLTLLLFGYGWPRPIPVNKWKLKRPVLHTVIVAFMGPIANLVLAILLSWLYFFLITNHFNVPKFVSKEILLCAKLSAGFGIFNLLPIPPMDGAKIILAFLPDEYMGWYVKYEVYGILLLVVLIILRIPNFLMAPVNKLLEGLMHKFML